MIAEFHKKTDQRFVETRVSHKLENILGENHWVTIIGKSGDGKSATAAHLLLKYMEKGYEPLFLSSPKYWTSFISNGKLGDNSAKQFVLIDDMFGTTFVDDIKVNKWVSMIENMEKVVKERNGELLVVCISRRVIFKDVESKLAKFKSFKFVIDMTDDENCLLGEEKIEIFKRFIIEYKIKGCDTALIKDVNPPHGFPHCVELYCTSDKFRNRGLSFFINPVEAVREDLNTLDVRKFLVLLLVLYSNNHVESFGKLLNQPTDEVKRLFELYRVEVNSFSLVVKETLKSLSGPYITYAPDGACCFAHESVLESVAFVHISTASYEALKMLSFDYVVSFVNNVSKRNDSERKMMLNLDILVPFVERITDEILLGNILAVCQCDIWGEAAFVKQWLKYISKDHKAGLETILLSSDNIGYDSIIDRIPNHLSREHSEFHSLLAFYQWQTAGINSLLEGLTYFNRQQAVIGILKNVHIQRSMENIAKWNEARQNTLHIANTVCKNYGFVYQLLCANSVGKLDGSKTLMTAIELSHIKCATLLLRYAEINLRHTDDDGNGYLHYLVALDISHSLFEELFEMLLFKGADVNQTNRLGESPLITLIDSINKNEAHSEKLEYLVTKGADIQTRDCNGRNLVLKIAQTLNGTKCLEMLKIVRKLNADFTCTDDKGQNAVHFICANIQGSNKDELLMYLTREIGVDQSAQDNNMKIPLMLALESDPGIHCIKQLLQMSPREHTDTLGQGFFHYLCRSVSQYERFCECCRLLSDAGEDINLKDFCGYSPLFVALKNRRFTLKHFRILVEYGAIKLYTNTFNYILEKRTENDDTLELLQYFFCSELNYNVPDEFDRNPLHYLCMRLKEKSECLNCKKVDWCRNTCYHPSIVDFHEIFNFLKETVGCDCNQKDKYGDTPKMLAQKYSHDLAKKP